MEADYVDLEEEDILAADMEVAGRQLLDMFSCPRNIANTHLVALLRRVTALLWRRIALLL